jgi:Stage II sporulation protein E (SpoIIE)/GAF domain
MSIQQRRLAGLLIAIALIAVCGIYGAWRMADVAREGWAGIAYMPDVRTRSGKAPPSLGPYSPGLVFMIYPGSPAERAGIEKLSRVVSIDDIPISDVQKISRLADRVRSGTEVVYRVEKNGAARDHRVRFLPPTRVPLLVAVLSVTVIVALTYLLIGTFVFWRLPTDSRAVVFFVMTIFAALSFFASFLAQFEGRSMRGFVVETRSAAQLAGPVIVGVMTMFFAPLLLHLALIFPRPRPVVSRGRTLFIWIYGLPFATLIAAFLFLGMLQLLIVLPQYNAKVVTMAIGWTVAAALAAAGVVSLLRILLDMRRRGAKEGFVNHPIAFMTILGGIIALGMYLSGRVAVQQKTPVPVFVVLGVVALIFIAILISYPVATFVTLLRSYRGSGIEERRQVKWPLWASMIAVGLKVLLAFMGFVLGFMVTMGSASVPNILNFIAQILSPMVYVIIPIAFAFAILKYRLMNIDIIIRKTVLYTLLSAVVIVLYGALVAGAGTLLIRFARVENTTMVIASTIVVALVAVPLRNRLQQMVDRNLFRERRDYPLALRNIGHAIGGSDTEGFLRYAAEQLQHALQTRFIAIAMRSDEHFVMSAKVGISDELVGRLRIPVSRAAEAVPPELKRLGAVVVVPVSAKREPLGLIASGAKLSDQAINDDDLDFLNSAASQIALGIENSRLRTEEAEFAQARAIQQVLLPTQFPRLDGFQLIGRAQPARSVGGDYFDVLALGDRKVALCIGDVAGKGMPAALLMANLQAAVKATAGPDVSPTQLCENVKRVVGDNLAGGKFISFFYGVLDASTRTLTYTNAGHNPPILARAGGEIERLTHGGPAFCRLFRDDPHSQAAVQIDSGDRLVLFTDGASEARRGEDEFGEDRLAAFIAANRTLSAAELQARIVEELTEFTSGSFHDDVTLVVAAAE